MVGVLDLDGAPGRVLSEIDDRNQVVERVDGGLQAGIAVVAVRGAWLVGPARQRRLLGREHPVVVAGVGVPQGHDPEQRDDDRQRSDRGEAVADRHPQEPAPGVLRRAHLLAQSGRLGYRPVGP